MNGPFLRNSDIALILFFIKGNSREWGEKKSGGNEKKLKEKSIY